MTDDDAYEPGDPKHPGWADDLEEQTDLHRHDEMHDLGPLHAAWMNETE